MRVTLADATLARQAGRFVWLELDYDKEANQAFLAGHGVAWTPAFFVLDPADERATATQFGGMTLPELNRFLDQGESGVKGKARSPAYAALARGDERAGHGRPAEAAASYREALRIAGPKWPERAHAVDALISTLQVARDTQACAETAAAEAPGMARERSFASVVHVGLGCANSGRAAPWAEAARKILEPLAAEAAAVPTALRDDRFEIYQQMMVAADRRGDAETRNRWGRIWLAEIDATTPTNDDERTALDIARVDAVSILGEPALALPALAASERAMPDNYTASARLAAIAADAGRYDDALAACDRALAHASGPMGRTMLFMTKAQAWDGKREPAKARAALEDALTAASAIGDKRIRDNHVAMIKRMIADMKPADR